MLHRLLCLLLMYRMFWLCIINFPQKFYNSNYTNKIKDNITTSTWENKVKKIAADRNYRLLKEAQSADRITEDQLIEEINGSWWKANSAWHGFKDLYNLSQPGSYAKVLLTKYGISKQTLNAANSATNDFQKAVRNMYHKKRQSSMSLGCVGKRRRSNPSNNNVIM